MTRLESSVWPLACGSACVFMLSVVLDRLPWQTALVVVAASVVAWAWRISLVTGAAIGGIAWMCVTGFDVHGHGDIRITGRDDAVRAAVLVLAGLLAAAVHAISDARSRYERADPLWAELHATGLTQVAAGPSPSGSLGALPPRSGPASLAAQPIEEETNG